MVFLNNENERICLLGIGPNSILFRKHLSTPTVCQDLAGKRMSQILSLPRKSEKSIERPNEPAALG